MFLISASSELLPVAEYMVEAFFSLLQYLLLPTWNSQQIQLMNVETASFDSNTFLCTTCSDPQEVLHPLTRLEPCSDNDPEKTV